ncbi:hypothetical protein E2C01_051327 [Portunus trituberculatus]|uniref:Uncharacterized protein n=1 Tax=Portunus trituberculatus TaxID=210409 RepID=A0A5B7GK05_PORTR|nr:hypothetical protein [Portunus trituberculatus]
MELCHVTYEVYRITRGKFSESLYKRNGFGAFSYWPLHEPEATNSTEKTVLACPVAPSISAAAPVPRHGSRQERYASLPRESLGDPSLHFSICLS